MRQQLSSGRPQQRGFVLIGILIVLSLAALAAVQSGQHLSDTRQRANEEDLLYVGEQYRQAIESYWRQSPNGLRSLPARLDDLVLDPRFPQPRRHLRKLYVDPIAPEVPWGVIMLGKAVVGVYSQAEGVPFRQAGFSDVQVGFDNAQRYADWRFNFTVPAPAQAPGGKPAPNPSNPRAPATPAPVSRGAT
jgi:type II secretory pathway pseudopilin PulG